MKLQKDEILDIFFKYLQVRFRKRENRNIEEFGYVENYYSVGHVQFFTTRIGNKFFIFFIDSNEPQDWKFNLLFGKKQIPYKESGTNEKIKVHKGFYNSYLMIRDIVREVVEDEDNIFFFGHSLGSGIATLAALDTQYNNSSKSIETYLFGSPRVGNRHFVMSYNKRLPDTYRFINGNDIVTRLPFKVMFYRHVSNSIFIKKPSLLKEIGISIYFSSFFEDHWPKRYFENLETYL